MNFADIENQLLIFQALYEAKGCVSISDQSPAILDPKEGDGSLCSRQTSPLPVSTVKALEVRTKLSLPSVREGGCPEKVNL